MTLQPLLGIWQYTKFLPRIAPQYQLTLGEGSTNLETIESVFFKKESENPSGSVKDRGLAYQISKAVSCGFKKFVIPSSGNAAISAANFCQKYGFDLIIFLPPKIKQSKLNILTKFNFSIKKTLTPLRDSLNFAKTNHSFNLRQSIDKFASFGYETISFEIIEKLPKVDAVFIPVSSGTTLVGIYQGFLKMHHLPSLHAVQTEKVHPVASYFDRDFIKKETSLADAIIAKYTPRRQEVISKIKKSQGYAWVIADSQMIKSQDYLLKHGVNCSYEGAATLAALGKAIEYGYKYNNPVCLLTGKFYE